MAKPQSPTTAGPVPNSQTPNHPSFRRQRASRACETCHSRKVRCDAASLGVPCTNCVAFQIECKIPPPKRKKTHGKAKDSDSDREIQNDDSQTFDNTSLSSRSQPGSHSADGMPMVSYTQDQVVQQENQNGAYAQFMKPKFARAPIKEAGRVAYLGESSNLSLLVHDKHGSQDVVHYPLPDTVRGIRAKLTEIDNVEIEILHQRGAFLLPPRALCDELVDSYFRWVAPVVPVVNKSRFMRQYRDSKNPPSLLLLQAVLLAGSRVCNNPQLMDANGSTTPAAMTFYKRAKALYDANYEDDRVTIVQALILMGWYWEGPEDVTKNVFYWTRVATIVAQGSGMHRSVESSQLSRADKRLWKRIWWTLFTRDRSVAVALGRPIHINVDDSDVEMLTEDDFLDDEVDQVGEYPPDQTHVQFFLQYVRLCEIMGLVLSQQYSVASKARRQNAINLTHSDMALADWLQNCPKIVRWEKSRHHFWSALLHANYYTTLCLLHRAHMPPATASQSGYVDDAAYPSRNIAFQAAGMITLIVEQLQTHDELRYTPAFIVYSLFSALIMHVYQLRSHNPSIVMATQERIQICMNAMQEVSKVWLVAKMVHTLFTSILGNKNLEERLQKAAGKRHKRARIEKPGDGTESPPKTKLEEMTLGYAPNHGQPQQHQVSFERSRPVSPAVTPRQQHRDLNAMNISPTVQQNQNFKNDNLFLPPGQSRGNTRPGTPFNPSYSIPASPPDLYLITRDEPNLSDSLWQNFQPDQLFPETADVGDIQHHFGMQNGNLDPALMHQMQTSPTVGQSATSPPIHHNSIQHNAAEWNHGPQMSPDDSWSVSSGGQPVPTTLNVEDWYNFFGVDSHAQVGVGQQNQDMHM